MGYKKLRAFIHIGAFLIGTFSISWIFLSICIVAHYFISPAMAYQITRTDPDEIFETKDTETAMRVSRTVRILTIQSCIFSAVMYLIGFGINFLLT